MAQIPGSVTKIEGVRLPKRPNSTLWDISFSDIDTDSSPQRWITSITPHATVRATEPLAHPAVFPSLAHPHIHLDKAFLHFSPEYSDLLPAKGSFDEALSYTAQAKSRFTLPDLLRRGRWLLEESVAYGVTAIRAFVEVDATVKHQCLTAAIQLKEEWKHRCHIQIVCFAQDPIFSGPHGDENRRLMETAIRRPEVDVIGTTPYVETGPDAAVQNIEWAVTTALEHHKHLDFHLDYTLDTAKPPMVWDVIDKVEHQSWTSKTDKRIMLGHCTRLTLFSSDVWTSLARKISQSNLPISFVGLPTSDLYMASVPQLPKFAQQPRGTLPICSMVRELGLNAVLGINNVGNAFTPWGSCDPLALASLGVGIYQAGTQDDVELLYECVSSRARAAMGLGRDMRSPSVEITEGDPVDLLVVRNMRRGRGSVADLVWDPSIARRREVLFNGSWVAVDSEQSEKR